MNKKIFAVLLIAGLVALAVVVLREHFNIEAIRQFVTESGQLGWVVFVVIYALAAILLLPATLLTLLGGLLFGPVVGTALNLAGATLGATGAFLIARHGGGTWVRERAGGKLNGLLERIEHEGWRAVAFFRLVPLFPFNLLNYALGLSKIGLIPYVLTSIVCMAPLTAAYTFFGHSFGLAFTTDDAPWVKYLIGGLVLVALMLFIPKMLKRKDTSDA